MKKIKTFITGICLLIALLTAASAYASDAEIKVISKTLARGSGTEGVEVPLEISKNPGILGMTLKISYTKGITLTGIDEGDALKNLTFTPPGNLSANPFKLVWDGLNQEDNTTGNLVILKFEVPKDVEKSYAITITSNGIYDGDVADVTADIVNGYIKVENGGEEDFSGISLENSTYKYDGLAKEAKVSGIVPEGANITYTYNGSEEKPSDAGTYNVVATISKDGMEDLILEAVMTIQPKELTVTGITASDKEYDGKSDAVVSGGALSGKVTGDDVGATFPGKGSFKSVNAGKDIVVYPADITLSGNDKNNYKIIQPSGLTADILPRKLNVKAKNCTIKVNGAVPLLEYEITEGSLVAGETLSGSLMVTANTAVAGKYTITQGTLKASDNYSMTFTEGTLIVVNDGAQSDAKAVFTLEDISGRPGDIAEVKLSLKTSEAINSIGVENFIYDSEALTFEGFSDYEAIEDMSLLPPTFDDEEMAIVIALKEDAPFEGEICTLKFKINENANEGAYAIGAESIVKLNATSIESAVKAGSITVRNQMLGDINGNEEVDITDAVYLFRYSMMPERYPISYSGDIDFNNDGAVDIKDAVLLFRYSMMPDRYPID